MRSIGLALGFLLTVSPLVCCAQDNPDTPKPKEKVPLEHPWGIQLFGGYSLLRNTDNNSGFDSSITLRLAESWSLRADAFSVRYPSYLVVLIGPEYRMYIGRSERRFGLEPFFNTKAGVARSSTNDMGHQSSAAWSAGAGADLRVYKHFFLRPVELSYLRANLYKNNQNGTIYANNFHLGTGFGFRF